MKKYSPPYAPFFEQKRSVDSSSALYSCKVPFQLLHADIADIRIFRKFNSRSRILPSGSRHFHLRNLYLSHEGKKSFKNKNRKKSMKKLRVKGQKMHNSSNTH